jgi:O-antigen/teichoic acid export membrane protein
MLDGMRATGASAMDAVPAAALANHRDTKASIYMNNPIHKLRKASAKQQADDQQDGMSTRLRAARERAAAPSQDASTEPGFLRRVVDHWWDRLIGAVYSGSLSNQTARYAAHNQTRDYIANSVGMGVWGALFPILTIVASQLAGAEQAGMFSMAFVIANLLIFIGNYGVRTYQVSDIDETESFAAYQIQRVLSCVLMMLAGWLFCKVRGYAGEMLTICWGTFAFRVIDAFADVYEGRLQQMDKLYLAGISQALRCVSGVVVFSVVLFVTRSIPVASIALAIVAAASLVIVTIPLALFETPKSRKWELQEVREIFKECFPAFLAQFVFTLIESVPKFVMEGVLPYKAQLVFNAIYFPAQSILMVIGLVYKPQLVRLANIWSDPSRRKRFDLIIVAVLALCAVLTAVYVFIAAWIGIPITSFLYGLNFEPYRTAQYLMLVAGGMTAAIDFLYQIITVLRQQQKATGAYGIALAVVLVLSGALVPTIGFNGAVWAYFLVMVVLLALMVVQYVRVRLHPKEF